MLPMGADQRTICRFCVYSTNLYFQKVEIHKHSPSLRLTTSFDGTHCFDGSLFFFFVYRLCAFIDVQIGAKHYVVSERCEYLLNNIYSLYRKNDHHAIEFRFTVATVEPTTCLTVLLLVLGLYLLLAHWLGPSALRGNDYCKGLKK